MRVCQVCGGEKKRLRESKEFGKTICDNCYNTLKYHPFEYIPPEGEIHYDKKGRVICHICGRPYDVLSNHIVGKHNITVDKYKEKFGLNRTAKLTSKSIQERYKENPSVDISTIRVVFEDGHTKTKGIKRRLQTIKNRTGMKYNVRTNEKKD